MHIDYRYYYSAIIPLQKCIPHLSKVRYLTKNNLDFFLHNFRQM